MSHTSAHMLIRDDIVTGPDGRPSLYDWVDAADQVRVACLVDGQILLVEQEHYLIGKTWQLPGGSVGARESDGAAARRELQQETGFRGGEWKRRGALFPLPSLSPMRVHLWSVSNSRQGASRLEPGEADLRVMRLAPHDAVEAARKGRIACASSLALILLLSGADASSPAVGWR